MANENAILNAMDVEEVDLWKLALNELSEEKNAEFMQSLQEISFLEEEKEKIQNPEALGETIYNEILEQFKMQTGLDLTAETLTQKYDRVHPESYKEVGEKVLQDKQYKMTKKEMEKMQEDGNLKDAYTGMALGKNDKFDVEHVEARKEIFERKRRRQAGLSTEDLANKPENLVATNPSLNRSKGAKSISEYLEYAKQKEEKWIKESEKEKQRIDASNRSETEKSMEKAKVDKRLRDKLDRNEKMMKEADAKARKAINRDIRKEARKNINNKAWADAKKRMAVEALVTLAQEIINGMIRFFKEKAKSFKLFLEEIKESLKRFWDKVLSFFQTGATAFASTVVAEILGPISEVFDKLASLIKQGVASLLQAIEYLKDKENKNKPFCIKVAEIGKIVVAGLATMGALFTSEAVKTLLLEVPGLQIEIPGFGTFANIISIFLTSLISGVIGAIVINLIDKFIVKKQREEFTTREIEKQNEAIQFLEERDALIQLKKERIEEENVIKMKKRHGVYEAMIIEDNTPSISDRIEKKLKALKEKRN